MYNKEKLGNLLIDLAKIIFAIGFYSVIVKESTDKINFAIISFSISLIIAITSFILTKNIKK